MYVFFSSRWVSLQSRACFDIWWQHKSVLPPSVDIPHKHTNSIPQLGLVCNNEETYDRVLNTRLEEKNEHFEQEPMTEQLSRMFLTTKHCWYPREQYHSCPRNLDPPKDGWYWGSQESERCYLESHLPFDKMQLSIFTNMLCSKIITKGLFV